MLQGRERKQKEVRKELEGGQMGGRELAQEAEGGEEERGSQTVLTAPSETQSPWSRRCEPEQLPERPLPLSP